MCIIIIHAGSDPDKIAYLRVWSARFRTAGREGRTRWVLVAGEGPDEEGVAARPVAHRKERSWRVNDEEVNGPARIGQVTGLRI